MKHKPRYDFTTTKVCKYCQRELKHVFGGRYGSERETAAGNKFRRPFYVDDLGRRWYDSRCNDCFRKYMREYRRKRREILKGKDIGPVGGDGN